MRSAHQLFSIFASNASTCTCDPTAAFNSATTPSNGAVRPCSIFIASSVSSFWPLATVSPAATSTAITRPGIGARIAPSPAHLLELGKESPPPAAASGSSPIRQNLDLEAFRAETKLPLRTDVSLQQSGPASEGLQRDWPAPALGLERHYGYAFQWFGLSALVVILYVWFQFITPIRRSRRRARDGRF